jgi:hypothetical protein
MPCWVCVRRQRQRQSLSLCEHTHSLTQRSTHRFGVAFHRQLAVVTVPAREPRQCTVQCAPGTHGRWSHQQGAWRAFPTCVLDGCGAAHPSSRMNACWPLYSCHEKVTSASIMALRIRLRPRRSMCGSWRPQIISISVPLAFNSLTRSSVLSCRRPARHRLSKTTAELRETDERAIGGGTYGGAHGAAATRRLVPHRVRRPLVDVRGVPHRSG